MDDALFHIELIEEKLHYSFLNKEYLKEAFIHRSFRNENKGTIFFHNERLEFLGDAVLSLICSEFLFNECPTLNEGELSHLRSSLVEASACSKWLQQLEVESFLLLGKGEMMNAKRGRESLNANLFEALLGAIYLDGGFEKAKVFFLSHFREKLLESIKNPLQNWKALLQEHMQKKYQKQPVYKVLREEGPAHEKLFEVGVYFEEKELAIGKGLSKKEAEQHAAQKAFKKLQAKRENE